MNEVLFHPIPPVYDQNSRILILGTFPSPKSRESGFFYGHPQNRFWKVISRVLNWKLPESINEKKEMLISNRIALWDVIASCEITGADDGSIRNPKPNPIEKILLQSEVKAIFSTGKKSFHLYRKLIYPRTAVPSNYLPSPSPANCRISLDELVRAYDAILPWL
ncbi:MAG TPA: DNA-deoxyinosine glycosylase [Flexilinea sp.]|nr:DNA-deoxyinosine glycosylase [Flexilinea sp.]